MSQFLYLLNAMEGAAQSENPFERGYPEKRRAVLEYVAKLEAVAPSAVVQTFAVTQDGPLGGFATVGPDAAKLDLLLTQFQIEVEATADEESPAEEQTYHGAMALDLKRQIIDLYTPSSAGSDRPANRSKTPGVHTMAPDDVIEWAIGVLRGIVERHPEVLRDCDVESFIADQLQPTLDDLRAPPSAREEWPVMRERGLRDRGFIEKLSALLNVTDGHDEYQKILNAIGRLENATVGPSTTETGDCSSVRAMHQRFQDTVPGAKEPK